MHVFLIFFLIISLFYFEVVTSFFAPFSPWQKLSSNTVFLSKSSIITNKYQIRLGNQEDLIPSKNSEAAGRGITLNEYDFCLSPSDSAVSKDSITKLLNTISSKAMKQIMIGIDFSKEIEILCDKINATYGGSAEYENAFQYLRSIQTLANGRQEDYLVQKLDAFYSKSYLKIINNLEVNKCIFLKSETETGVTLISKPKEQNICLSVLDFASPKLTRTKYLNTIANQVHGILHFGTEDEINQLALQLDIQLQDFIKMYQLDTQSQEVLFYQQVRELLNVGAFQSSSIFGKLQGPYLNSFERLFSKLVAELGSTSTRSSYVAASSFTGWEREFRKNMTISLWDKNPPELVGTWQFLEDRDSASWWTQPGLVPEEEIATIKFNTDGTVTLNSKDGVGLSWFIEPGPTHLDTVQFQVVAGAAKDRLFTYIGYIDRCVLQACTFISILVCDLLYVTLEVLP